MPKTCSLAGCSAPEVTCSIGEPRFDDCPHWVNGSGPVSSDPEGGSADIVSGEFRFPWTGNVMGPADVNYLAGARALRLVTLAGAADAGKTSLLAAFYLLIGRGIYPAGVSFSGSLTLEGWENIAGSLRWATQNGPSFPPHTSSGAGRRPGMLHLSLNTNLGTCELMAADAPGEWFSTWAVNESSPQADGARWLAECSDVVLVVADSAALAGAQRGQARLSLIDLLRRVGSQIGTRPVALVWTKCDEEVSAEITSAIKEAANRSLRTYSEFRVSMHPDSSAENQNSGQGIIELLEWILTAAAQGYEAKPVEVPELTLLRTFGRRNGQR